MDKLRFKIKRETQLVTATIYVTSFNKGRKSNFNTFTKFLGVSHSNLPIVVDLCLEQKNIHHTMNKFMSFMSYNFQEKFIHIQWNQGHLFNQVVLMESTIIQIAAPTTTRIAYRNNNN